MLSRYAQIVLTFAAPTSPLPLYPRFVKILLTNDDGIRAPGILALYDALLSTPHHQGVLGGGPISDIMVVAPLTVQSATSHGVTFHTPLMSRTEMLRTPAGVSVTGIAVDGRPADCVKLAIANLWPARFGKGSKPDLIISGMNAGANCGINVLYSGTVAAAIEGAFLGIPSIAVSLRMGKGKTRFDLGAHRARAALERVLALASSSPLLAHEILSINIPPTEEPWPKGEGHSVMPELAGVAKGDNAPTDPHTLPTLRVCPMNVHGLIDNYEPRTAPSGEQYFWAAGHGLDFHATEPGTDVDLLMQGFTTITPLKYDLTRHEGLARWRRTES
jgi:5'-nucleotidase